MIAPEVLVFLAAAERAFSRRFGRPSAAEDPLLFDPSEPEPRPLDAAAAERLLREHGGGAWSEVERRDYQALLQAARTPEA